MSDSMHLLESVFNTSVQPIIVIDAFGIVQQYNAAAEKLFQYTAPEILGKNIKKIMPLDEAKKHDGYLKHYRKTREEHIIGTGREVIAQKKDGELCHIFLSISEIKIGEQLYFAGIMHDMTLEKHLSIYNKKLFGFNLEIIKKLGSIENHQAFIETVLSSLSKLFAFDLGHFYEYDGYNNYLKSTHSFFLNGSRKYNTFVQVTKKMTCKKGVELPGLAWKNEQVVFLPDILKAKNFSRRKLTKKPLHLTGGMAFPVISKGNLLGVFEFYTESRLAFDSFKISLFKDISKLIGGLYTYYQVRRTLDLILNNCGEGIYGLDSKGITTFVNPRACQILGYSADELIGYSMHEKIHNRYPDGRPYPRSENRIINFIRMNKPACVDNEVFWSKSNKPIPVEYTVTPIIENENILGGVVTFLDVSEKRKVTRRLEAISDLQARYIAGKEKERLFDETLAYLIECTDSEYGFLAAVLKDEDGTPYLKTYSITDIAWNKATRALYERSVADGLEFRNLETLFGYTLKTGKIVISHDPKNDKRAGGLPKGHPALNTYLGVPIFGLKGDMVAMYGLANRKEGYTQQIVEDIKPLTHAISGVVESIQHYRTIANMARLDALTKIYNRQYFDLKFNDLIEAHRQQGTGFSILMVDLNKFKAVNDIYGQQIGDEILILFTRRVKNLLKEKDVIARLGGDEFIIVLQDIQQDTHAIKVARRLVSASEEVYEVQGKLIYSDITIGIASYPSSGKTASTLLKHVDFALYDAKNNQEKWRVYSKSINKRYNAIMKLEKILASALKSGAFYLVYQPQINLKTNSILGFEALLRLKRTLKKEIPANVFIPILEKFGYAEKLNEYVVRHLLEDITRLENKEPLKISVNISPKVSKIDEHILNLIRIIQESKKLLQQKQVMLEFEITESSFTNGSSALLGKALSITKKAGISCAMDDFGIEYSSISRLTQYPFDMVKIDQFFVHKLDKKQNKLAKAVIKALIQLADDLNFTILAEGPETKAQVECLIEMGCEYVQGFYFYKPMSIPKINRLMK